MNNYFKIDVFIQTVVFLFKEPPTANTHFFLGKQTELIKEISTSIYAGIIVPVFNKIFPFNQKKEVLEYEKPGVRKER